MKQLRNFANCSTDLNLNDTPNDGQFVKLFVYNLKIQKIGLCLIQEGIHFFVDRKYVEFESERKFRIIEKCFESSHFEIISAS